MKITVTQEDIDNGDQSVPDGPVPLALNRCVGGKWYCGSRLAWRDGESRNHELPENAVKFIVDFDTGKPVEPFTFELPI